MKKLMEKLMKNWLRNLMVTAWVAMMLSLVVMRVKWQQDLNDHRVAPFEGNFMMFLVHSQHHESDTHEQMVAAANSVSVPQVATVNRMSSDQPGGWIEAMHPDNAMWR